MAARLAGERVFARLPIFQPDSLAIAARRLNVAVGKT
jgi:hypothetical protein